jgi:anhydro-N-acetylmuramic acid kinase
MKKFTDKTSFNVIATMSGTSLDGLDIIYVNFYIDNYTYKFDIKHAVTYPFTENEKTVLREAHNFETTRFLRFHNAVGTYIGEKIKKFIKQFNIKNIDFISSHGHTIFHRPEDNFTFQAGNPAYIASETGITTVGDFRTLDIAHKGQGAPLVPIGDKYLFPGFDACLNIGGIANISFEISSITIAYDISPANMAFNLFAKMFNMEYDKDGNIGKQGHVDDKMLMTLNSIDYYHKRWPKSLSKEWFDNEFMKIIKQFSKIETHNQLRTIYEHVAMQIVRSFDEINGKDILVTGGGAYNKFLIDLIREKTTKKIIIPEKIIIEYKEALIFAFLGLLRILQKTNTLASVTGAVRDSIGGAIYMGDN